MLPDACTWWPDTMFGYDWSQCCVVHDLAYKTLQDKLPADLALGFCVSQQLPIMGIIMALGVILFGSFFYPWKGKVDRGL